MEFDKAGEPVLTADDIAEYGENPVVETFDQLTDPGAIITIAEMEAENANQHGLDVARIWEAVKEFVPKKKQADAAKALVSSMDLSGQ